MREAAKGGHTEAQHVLGDVYFHGTDHGVEANHAIALAFYEQGTLTTTGVGGGVVR